MCNKLTHNTSFIPTKNYYGKIIELTSDYHKTQRQIKCSIFFQKKTNKCQLTVLYDSEPANQSDEIDSDPQRYVTKFQCVWL